VDFNKPEFVLLFIKEREHFAFILFLFNKTRNNSFTSNPAPLIFNHDCSHVSLIAEPVLEALPMETHLHGRMTSGYVPAGDTRTI
jgi:hypothetical protein